MTDRNVLDSFSGLIRVAGVGAIALAGLTCKDSSGPSTTAVARVVITPDSAAMFAGDSIQLSAAAKNTAGATIPDRTITWAVVNATIVNLTPSGRVRGLRLGRTMVVASSEGRADTAVVNVKVITSTVVSPDLDSLRSVNDSLQLTAMSYGDIEPHAGSYTWSSSNPAAATVSASGVVVARADGSAWITAIEAGGTRDSALIVVNQRVAHVLVSPGAASRPVGRTQPFSAQATDARGNIMIGLTFIWSSRNPVIATVDPSGLATAVAVGVDTIDAIAAGLTGSAAFTVAPQPALSFSFSSVESGVNQDAMAIGGSPLSISAPGPVESAVTVTVSNSSPPIASASTGMTIAPGQTTAPLMVTGLLQGTARLIASAPGYLPDTADVLISTPRLAVQRVGDVSSALQFGETRQFQVLLTDSSGTRHNTTANVSVSITSSDNTVLTVNASTTTVSAGANGGAIVAISPQGVGTARIYLSAPGYFGDSTLVFTVTAPQIGFDFDRRVIGLRQSSGSNAGQVILPQSRGTSVLVTFTQKHPEFVQFPGSATVGANATTAAIGSWSGVGFGEDTIVATAFSFAPETMFVRVGTPKILGDAVPPSILFGAAPLSMRAQAADTLNSVHFALDTVAVRVTSSNPAVLSPDSTYIHILKGASVSPATGLRPVGVGSATITLTDSAGLYLSYTTSTVAVSPISLTFSAGRDPAQPVTVGMRQRTGGGTNSLSLSVGQQVTGSPLTISLANSNTTVATVPPSVVIPVGATTASFDVTGQDVVGTADIVASAFGYSSDTLTVDVGLPRFRIETVTAAYTTSPPAQILVIAVDHTGAQRVAVENVVATLTSSNAGVLAPDSATMTILAGRSSHNTALAVFAGAGTATITASDSRVAPYRYASGVTDPISVALPPLSLSFASRVLGVGQNFSAAVAIPSGTLNPGITVVLSHSNGSVSSTPSTVLVGSGQYSTAFQVNGLALGVDTIVATASGYLPDTAVVSVRPDRVTISGLPATISIANDNVPVHLQVLDPNGVPRNVTAATTFDVFTSSHLAVNGRAGTSTQIVIAAGNSLSPAFIVTGRATGIGLLQVTNPNLATVARNVTVVP
ncbi:MAG: Ig-like domain-containing protein [Gemmatimonadaceae bacterium]